MRRTILPKGLNLETVIPDRNGGCDCYSRCYLYSQREKEWEPFWRCIVGEIPTVYFLMQGEQVVYIGSTMRPTIRIGWHVFRKEFDTVRYFETARFRQIEKRYIRMFQPRYNKVGLPKTKIIRNYLSSTNKRLPGKRWTEEQKQQHSRKMKRVWAERREKGD